MDLERYLSLELRTDIFSCSSLFVPIFLLRFSSLFDRESATLSNSALSSSLLFSYQAYYYSKSLLSILSYQFSAWALVISLSRRSTFFLRSVFSFWRRVISKDAFSMASSIILASFSLFFFISYYNNMMAHDFNSKIQNLSNKLNNLHKPNKKEVQIDQVKDQLRKLEQSLHKQLSHSQKRIDKIEYKLSKKLATSKRSQMAINNVWSDKQQKVSELIGTWVQNYEEQAEQALLILERQQKNYQIKLQEQQQIINKQVRMEENRVKDLIHVLEKEINKLQSIHSQQQTATYKEIASAKQLMQESFKNCQQVMEEKQQEIQNRLRKMRESIMNLQNSIKLDLSNKSHKLKQVMMLLLDIQ